MSLALIRATALPLSIICSVMPGLVPGIHVVLSMAIDVDGRDRPGHDDVETDGY
ncbi:hypothetical protein [Bradyrhizobium sp. STM 3809]|uniref:hypothetical protein n=1 Tax=Bradyrhizobium sp. STM 3809 TaxID=551936 RepID=UPI0002409CF0|nr:hypothetical protein [Bradyrhizobium sp. STM 3809]CCE01556.1 conserved hypothetical protein [Bradyrhizobium sp. STM 3809]